MRNFFAALGLCLAAVPGAVDAFVAPAGGSISAALSTRSRLVGDHAGCRRSKGTAPAIISGSLPARRQVSLAPSSFSSSSSAGSGGAGTAKRKTSTALSARGGQEEEETPTSAAAMSGVGSAGSNLLLLLASVMVVKGLLLPENIRHLGFCPTEDPIRGRDTLPWRMMIESGRECGTIPEVMTKYVTAPLAFPGTPEWGVMLNTKEDLAKDAWLK